MPMRFFPPTLMPRSSATYRVMRSWNQIGANEPRLPTARWAEGPPMSLRSPNGPPRTGWRRRTGHGRVTGSTWSHRMRRRAAEPGQPTVGARKETSVEKIRPHLWFDREAVEAAELYSSTFSDSRITNVTTLHDTPSGDTDIVSFELFGQPFMAISAGPLFRFTPAVSFLVSCSTKEETDSLWKELSEGG